MDTNNPFQELPLDSIEPGVSVVWASGTISVIQHDDDISMLKQLVARTRELNIEYPKVFLEYGTAIGYTKRN